MESSGVNILVIVGTESGNAQMVGETVADELGRLGHHADLVEDCDGGLDALDLPGRDALLVCTSTHGLGELPDNLIPFADALKDQSPDLSALMYGVIALGDQTYGETFCRAGKDMDALLASLGARKRGERLEIDACTQPLPDEDAVDWLKDWLPLLEG
ncbi:flavodoxin/nitric oxide synthase [Roseospira navarrensis]|uniref:Flavodoxin/nitric oxide synthase n=2 Tax=Roseospira navarrensis TaxID=140058 RepID=A0A7X1ZDS7_9PROT|nr:flavodoxin/nitric oxide synthase [Roseospira navarrensis]